MNTKALLSFHFPLPPGRFGQASGEGRSCDSDRAGLRRIGVPNDWPVKGKYPGKIVYRWPPREKD